MAMVLPFFGSLSLLLAGLHLHCACAEPPKGHLEPFGGWMPGKPVEERTDVPGPQEFYEKYNQVDGGAGKPVVFRAAAGRMAATLNWGSDDLLLEKYGGAKITGVEYNLKETRAGGRVEGMTTLRKFLQAYNSSDIYMVSGVPKKMQMDVDFLPCLRCGGFLQFLDTNNMWFGRGGSKSVIHYDDQDNINCMIAGRKRFIFMHPRYKTDFEAHPNDEKRNRFGWVDTDLDRNLAGYGAFMGKIDVDSVDLIKYPGWRDVEWSFVDLSAGDCVYIPFQWYHQVTAEVGRSINVHIWYWRPAKFDAKSCAVDEASPLTLAQCSWGYEPRGGHLGTREKGEKPTKCKSKAPKQQASAERSDL